MSVNRHLIFLLLLLSQAAFAQFTYEEETSVAVTASGQPIPSPWAGGLNAAQYNTMDLDGDGQDDLVLFDRMANTVLTYLAQEGSYVHAPGFETFFPEGVTNWLLLRDYNCDGRKDIFTGDQLGIKVYTNTTEATGPLQFERFFFFNGSPTKSTVLLTKGFTSKINLQVQYDDLPSISDVDGDGDLDIFNIRFGSSGTVEYHRNFSKERYGNCDSLDFERITQAWGNFRECDCGVFAFNGETCPPDGGRTRHAGGKALLALDANGDQATDLLLSEAECTSLFLLENGGTTDSPLISGEQDYPTDIPANFLTFPAAFFEDVDFDGVRDLIAAPNIFSKEFFFTDLQHSNWFYKNTGTNAAPDFSYRENNFLQKNMIDLGDNAVPAVIDHDGDGDLDLFVTSNFDPDLTWMGAYVFENTGNISDPSFTLQPQPFLADLLSNYFNVKIQFTDINRDQKTDLVFTGTDFNTARTGLYYLLNKTSDGLDVSGQPLEPVTFNLTYPENISFVDIDGDGFPDILAGRSGGRLEYWRHNGLATPSFTLQEQDFLGTANTFTSFNASVRAADLDADGKLDLVLGDQRGAIQVYNDFRSQTRPMQAVSDIVFNPIAETYLAPDLGGMVWPVVANFFNTDKPAMIVGNVLGGLRLLRHDGGINMPVSPVVDLYPNPVTRSEYLTVHADRALMAQIFNSIGQKIGQPFSIPANEPTVTSFSFLPPGVYLIRFQDDPAKSIVRRVVVH